MRQRVSARNQVVREKQLCWLRLVACVTKYIVTLLSTPFILNFPIVKLILSVLHAHKVKPAYVDRHLKQPLVYNDL